MATEATSGKRTQAERSATTRAALLDAAVTCLVEEGYASVATSRVAELAGVTRGAHLHHFGTRQALVAAAVDELTERRDQEFREAIALLPEGGRERLEAGLDLIWAGYASPLFQAALALWTAGRTEPELREQLLDVERKFDRGTAELVHSILGDDRERIELVLATVRGMSLLDTLNPAGRRNERQWPAVRAQLVELLSPTS